MSLNISTASLRSLLALAEKREKLTADLASIEKQIAAAIEGSTPVVKTVSSRKIRGGELGNARLPRAPKKRGKRGSIKNLILEALKAAGPSGISVKKLSAKLGLKNRNVHVWFSTTGKSMEEIQKTGTGIYRFKETGAKMDAPVVAEKPAKAKTSRVSKPKIAAKKSRLTGKK